MLHACIHLEDVKKWEVGWFFYTLWSHARCLISALSFADSGNGAKRWGSWADGGGQSCRPAAGTRGIPLEGTTCCGFTFSIMCMLCTQISGKQTQTSSIPHVVVLSLRATLDWTCVRIQCCFLLASSLSLWSSVSPLLWSPPSPYTQSGSWWPLAPVTALAYMTTNRRTMFSSSKETQKTRLYL